MQSTMVQILPTFGWHSNSRAMDARRSVFRRSGKTPLEHGASVPCPLTVLMTLQTPKTTTKNTKNRVRTEWCRAQQLRFLGVSSISCISWFLTAAFRINRAILLSLVLAAGSAGAQVLINEVMYHPASDNLGESYIELRNLAATNANLSGWRFT